jgi:outer membrane protein insertion porin family
MPATRWVRVPIKIAVFLLITALGGAFYRVWAQSPDGRSTGATQPGSEELNSAAAFEGRPVTRIEIAARPDQNVAELRALIRQQPGRPFSVNDVQSSAAALQQAGGFKQVQVSVELETEGVRVLFLLQPVYHVGLVTFPHATGSMSYTQMLQAVNISLDAPFIRDELPLKEKALKDFFATQGYFAAAASATFQADDAHKIVNIAFDCNMNKRAKIGEIDIQGVSDEEASDIRHTLSSFWARVARTSLKPGTTYSRARIDKALDHLRAHFRKQDRLAPSVRANPIYDAESNRARLQLVVNPGPIVAVRVEGAHISKRTLWKLVPVYQEGSVDQDLIDEGQRNLVSYYQGKSYFDVTVESAIERQDRRVNVTYRVNEGKKHKVTSIRFEGNKYFDSKQLGDRTAIQQAKFILNRGKFNKDLLKKSADSLTTLYKNEGFSKIVVTPEVVDHEPDIDVTFRIDEGVQAKVRDFRTVGKNGEPLRLRVGNQPLQLGPGKPYSPHLLEVDRNRILAWYLNHGHPYAQFDSKETAHDGDTNSIDVVYQVDEGGEVKVGDVVLLGADHTKSKFLHSITDTNVQEDQPLSQAKLLRSEGDLYNLGVFDWATVAATSGGIDQASPVPPDSNAAKQDVLIRLHESRRNSMDVGAGLEIIPRAGNIPVGSVIVPGVPAVSLGNKFTVSQKSFIGPRGMFQFTRKNMRGRAETATLSLIGSRLDQRATFTYADPNLHGTTWSSLFSLSSERTTQNAIYTGLIQQVSFQVEKQLDRKRTQKIVTGYSYQKTDLSNILIPELVLPQDQHVKLSSVYVQYIHDSRDQPLDARHGSYQTVTFNLTPTAFGSSSSFVRFLGQTSFYKPITPWLTWANNLRVGFAAGFGDNGYVPLSERFFSGGPDSLRGFPINGAGPQRPVPVCSNPTDPSTCSLISVPAGGLMLAIVNSEARFPIKLIDHLGGVVFYDGGNVYSNINAHQFVSQYTNSVGIGFRYHTKVGPLRLDIGRNLNPIPGLKATQYFVTLGQAF